MPALLRICGRFLVALAGAAWASPMSLAGLVAGLAALPFGASLHGSDGALVFNRFPWGPGGALALGNVVLHTGETLDARVRTYAAVAAGLDGPRVRLGDHERAHVYQAMVLGPLFLPLYLACGGISHRNRFEQAADRYARTGRGWWPWPRPAGL